ncbi:acyl-CoA reductase [Novosphingobium album (ex Liu et al. 2023)]|uniref:long-chain-fatty-acyl-CoA reductase n=1 Tax=Novosphingobium album (ex Liu et al. 2023) TaxID=3031130 RepID=A0ABT5WNL8_9SPHN|nr:acyl-CoA reductase [Novosphingobium album (ex Liu et al. 2023)]MDE8651638.1 acyl-CoA reductase [Novosphingobium album (ex Liu et al. 2023)]
MTELYDIPIIARGRIIAPGEDAIEFKGRGGATFRAPDPHRHVHDLVLGNPVLLGDLAAMPMRQVIDFLAELGKRLRIADNPYLQESFELALRAGGLAEPILAGVYAELPAMFNPDALIEQVERTIGIDYLDGWVPAPGADGHVRVRAVGTRQLHITAGNVPVVAALTIVRGALTKSDVLIKSPSNDPLTANAIARTMIELDATHPVTRHLAVAYWKGGDEAMESQIVRTSRIDKITAWGGMSSVRHIQKFLTPGIDLTALNPKYSMSVIGREALEDEAAMDEAALGVAVVSGLYNQTACSNTRIVYVESEADDASLERVIEFGRRIAAAYKDLPPIMSTPAARPDLPLEAELEAAALEDEFYHVEGNTIDGGVVVSRFSDRVDFYDQLNNRVVNLVPVPNLLDVVKWCDDTTQTVGIYPESLRDRLLNPLALAGVQRVVGIRGGDAMRVFHDSHSLPPGMPHDGIEPLRRNVRWVIDHRPADEEPAFSIAAE